MKKSLILFSLCLIAINLSAQSFEWAVGFGGSMGDQGELIEVDALGNTYTVGVFQETVDFDPGPAVYNLTSAGSDDIFILKLDALGNFVWAKRIGAAYGDHVASMALDGSNNILLTGGFSWIVDFDPGPAIYNLGNALGGGCFILKLNSSGNFIWAKGLTEAETSGQGIDTDPLGNIYLSGRFNGTEDFDPGIGVFNLSTTSSGEMFFAKYDSMCTFIWAKMVTGGDGEDPFLLALDNSGNIFISGQFTGIVDFDPGPGVLSYTTNGWSDIFLAKYDPFGNLIWAKSVGGNDWDHPSGLDIDSFGNVYYVGEFSSDSMDCDPGPDTCMFVSSGSYTTFVSKLDGAGNFIWAKNMGYLQSGWRQSMHLDNTANIYCIGSFQGTIDFDPGVGVYNLISNGSLDICLFSLNSNGDFKWARNMGGASNWPADRGFSLTLDPIGNIYATGFFGIEADLDPGPGFANLSTVGETDAFVVKLNPCPDILTTITEEACVSYNFYGSQLTVSGIYNHPLMTSEGCDSVIRLNLTILTVDISVSQNANTLLASSPGAAYQWIDCANGNTAITGEISQSFTSTVNGSFAVIVTENGCTDTSACYTISNIGISENESPHGKFQLFPNPAQGNITISSPSKISSVELYSPTGKLLRKIISNNKQETFDISGLSPGNYFIRAIGREEVWVKKFVKI
ncbi:MAG: T9SS type A sorting domain-containing protein [Bacteroidales bacterium]|nr:T9SS type A sorting domain-containing protein [Bacteroidales bacterium]MCF8457655.1 T9SS type A sorting domain-containing protein [Bacteroidales bacterium]